MSLESWRDRLRSETKLRVHAALTDERAQEASRRTGDAAFLSYFAENAAESSVIGSPPEMDGIGPVRQIVSTAVSIVLRVTSARGPDEGLVEIERVRASVRDALLGWHPEGAESSVTFDRGQPLAVEGKGVQWWHDVYRCLQLVST